MSTETYWIEWIEKCIKEKQLKYYEYNEFNDIEELGSSLVGKVYKTNWMQSKNCLALKSFNLNNVTIKEIVFEIKLHWDVDFNDTMIKFYGITKTDSDEYLLVLEYTEGGTLRNYLKEKFLSLNWQDKYNFAFQLSSAIEYLHSHGVVHNNLHSGNLFIQQNSIKLSDFGLSRETNRILLNSFEAIPYIDPMGFNITQEEIKQIEKYKLSEKSDVYSVGVLFWEISSGKQPFASKEYDLSLAMGIAQGLRESIIESTPEEYYVLYTKCWYGHPDKRPMIQEVVMILKSMISSLNTENNQGGTLKPVTNLSSKQQIIQQFKLNHGLFLDGRSIKSSKQAVFSEYGVSNISLYKGQPLVYTSINDHNSHTNLLSFDPDNNDNFKLNEALQPSDICINFPVAEITYNADLLESFSKSTYNGEELYEIYGHLFAEKILVGGKLFINDLIPIQIDSFKSLLTWAYNLAKYNRENPFNNLSALDGFPRIITSDGKNLINPEKLVNWMNNLYQKNMADIISYNNLLPISELGFNKSSSVYTFQEKQPGVANFKEKLSLEEWVGRSINVIWTKELHLLQSLIINNHFELEIGKKIAMKLVNIPEVVSSDKFYMQMIKPTTNLEEFLISNNISSDEDITAFPFIKRSKESGNVSYGDYTHFIVKCEKYRILLDDDDIKPSEEFKQAIEKALKSMKPFVCLQDVFYEYGHLFPQSVVLGISLKIILPNSSFPDSEKIDLSSVESLKSHLYDRNISYLLTQKGNIIETNDLSDWIQSSNDDLEIIEYNKITSLYNILEAEQQKNIDVILKAQDSYNIIMTGIAGLKDLEIKNTEHYKRINIKPSLEDENYEVFGSIISKDNLKLEEFFVSFGLYDFNGFSAMISQLAKTNANIKECYILWMIVGHPSKLSVFSPKNRDVQVKFFKKSISLQPNQLNYHIEIPFPLSQDHAIYFNSHSLNFELKNTIELINWSNNSIYFKIINSTFNDSKMVNSIPGDDDYLERYLPNIKIAICILSEIAFKTLDYDLDQTLTNYDL